MPSSTSNWYRFSVHLQRTLHDRLAQAAEREGVSRSVILKDALEEYLKKIEEPRQTA